MTISQFLHVLRAAAAVSKNNYFMIFGSQAPLGNLLDKPDEYEFWKSKELDLAPLPFDQVISDVIDGCVGERSAFDLTFGIYAHACGIETPVFPINWESRSKNVEYDNFVIQVPSMEDIALSKYAAGREKDRAFVRKMWKDGLLDYQKIMDLLPEMPMDREETKGLDLKILEGKIDADSKPGLQASHARRDIFRPSQGALRKAARKSGADGRLEKI